MANNNAAARGLFCAYLNKLPDQLNDNKSRTKWGGSS